jgi:sortase A
MLAALAIGIGLVHLGMALFIPAKAVVAQVLLDRAWDRTLAGEPAAKPWPWADTWPVARIDVPRLEKAAVVLEGASGQAMAFGPGYMTNTAEIGGAGTAIVAAHRDTHFAFLKDLKKGDAVRVTLRDGETFTFVVSGTRIVHAAASGIDPDVGEGSASTLALVTCYPFDAIGRGDMRYVVFAEKINAEDV